MSQQRSSLVPIEDLLAEAEWLRALALRLVRDSASADDLAQGTLVAALEHRPERGRPLRPWLATVLRNRVKSTRRAALRREVRERKAARSEALPAEDEVLAQFEEQRRLAELVAKLDRPYRIVLLRHFYRGESAAHIARKTGQPSATVRSQLARALVRLRELHVREHGDDRRRSLAALGIAAGSGGANLAVPLATSTLASLFAMKTSTKLVLAVVAAGLVLIGGREGLRVLQSPAEENVGVAPGESDLAVPSFEGEESSALEEVGADSAERSAVPEVGEAPVAAQSTEARTALSMRVVDETGAPLESARLVFVSRDGTPHDLPSSSESEADGRILVDVVRRATFRYAGDDDRLTTVRLGAPGRAARFLVETIVEGSVVELGDRRLEPGADLAGRVLDARGAIVPGIEVVAIFEEPKGSTRFARTEGGGPGEDGAYLRTTTDAQGEYALKGLELRRYRLWFRRAGLRWNATEPFELLPGEARQGFDLLLPEVTPDALITGRVYRPDGTPAAEARVRWRTDTYWSEEALPLDDEARFVFQPASSAPHQLMAEHPDEAYSPSAVVSCEAGDDELRLELNPERRLRVVVEGEDGAAIERAWMRAYIDDAVLGDHWSYSDAEGVCSFLLPGEVFTLRVGCEGFEARSLGPLDPAQLEEELAVTLQRDPHIRGVVLADGAPVPGANVLLVRSMGERTREVYKGFTSRFLGFVQPVQTDGEGQFLVPLAEPKAHEWTLLVEKEGYATAEHLIGQVAAAADVPLIEIAMAPGGSLEGRLFVSPTRGLEGIVVACSRNDGLPRFTRTDAEGSYRFEHLAPGDWLVEDRERMPEGRSMSMIPADEMPFVPNVRIEEGVTSRLDIDTRWKDDLAVHGRLVLGGEGARGWTAHVDPGYIFDQPRVFEPVTLDADGRFSAPSIPGPMTLILRSPASGDVKSVIEQALLVGPDTAPVELSLSTGTLRGTGREPGDSLRTFQKLEDGTVIIQELSADEEGAFEAAGIICGPLYFQRDAGRGWETIDEPTLTPGEVLVVE